MIREKYNIILEKLLFFRHAHLPTKWIKMNREEVYYELVRAQKKIFQITGLRLSIIEGVELRGFVEEALSEYYEIEHFPWNQQFTLGVEAAIRFLRMNHYYSFTKLQEATEQIF